MKIPTQQKNIKRQTMVLIISAIVLGVVFTIVIWQEWFRGQKIMMSNAYKNNHQETSSTQDKKLSVTVFITPHHLLAKDLITNIFSTVATGNRNKRIDRVILISPNHFSVGNGEVLLNDEDWKVNEVNDVELLGVEGAKVLGDKKTVEFLAKKSMAFVG